MEIPPPWVVLSNSIVPSRAIAGQIHAVAVLVGDCCCHTLIVEMFVASAVNCSCGPSGGPIEKNWEHRNSGLKYHAPAALYITTVQYTVICHKQNLRKQM